jgi:cell division transport system ATP-binding protein
MREMIIFSSVTKKFGDNSPAINDISFSIDEGEMAVITGHSGSGKTSLMRLLTKEYLPDEGEITFLDTPLSSIRTSQVHRHRRNIGVVFQDYKLLHDLNVWENIALALSIIGASPSEIEKRVTDLLKLVDLVDKAFLFPSQLSGGEAQRVSIARALSTAPKMIFADEPTGNLDTETSNTIVKLLEKINALGTTIIVTTHDPVVLDVLGKARHLKLEKGKLVHDSNPNKKKTKEEDKAAAAKKESTEKDTKKETKDDSDTTKTRKRVSLKMPGFMLSPFKKKSKKEQKKNTDTDKTIKKDSKDE